MTLLSESIEGTFGWIDLATSDAEGAKGFYSAVFGWTFEDMPTDAGPDYTMFQFDGHGTCGMYQQPPEMSEQGIPPCWNSYIAVNDADAMTAKAESLGARVLQQPFDVMDVGRMSVISDLDGAIVSLWQDRKQCEEGGEIIVNVPNTWCWNELYCNNPEKEIAFYEDLFGWTHDTSKNPMGLDYVTYKKDGRELAGMLQIQSDWGEMPPVWGVYFTVADVQETMAKVKAAGGKVLMEPMAIPGVGEFTSITDPQGAFFNIIRLEQIPD